MILSECDRQSAPGLCEIAHRRKSVRNTDKEIGIRTVADADLLTAAERQCLSAALLQMRWLYIWTLAAYNYISVLLLNRMSVNFSQALAMHEI